MNRYSNAPSKALVTEKYNGLALVLNKPISSHTLL